jgi:RNA polymerase sigma-70 factor (ECF subfamily)
MGSASAFHDRAAPQVDQPAPMLCASDLPRLRRVVDQYFSFVARSLRGLGVRDADVDDALQQVFLVTATKLSLIPQGAEKAFLFRTAERVASRSRRTRLRKREVDESCAGEGCDPAPSPEELADHVRARALLDVLLEAMPDELRSVFVLFEIEQLEMTEIAAMLELPVGTVASRLRRAREDLRARIKRSRAQADARKERPR